MNFLLLPSTGRLWWALSGEISKRYASSVSCLLLEGVLFYGTTRELKREHKKGRPVLSGLVRGIKNGLRLGSPFPKLSFFPCLQHILCMKVYTSCNEPQAIEFFSINRAFFYLYFAMLGRWPSNLLKEIIPPSFFHCILIFLWSSGMQFLLLLYLFF